VAAQHVLRQAGQKRDEVRQVPRALSRRLGGSMVLQLRAEATNLFNTVNYSNPGTALNATATFGKIRTAGDMRQIQLGARLSF
jgi:hypothetical protein